MQQHNQQPDQQHIQRGKIGYGSAVEWLQGGKMTWRRAYPGRLDQVKVARDFAVYLFTGSGHEDQVAFIVTELVTNALRHTRSGEHGGWFGVDLTYADLAYIAVTDQGGSQVPGVMPAPPEGEIRDHGHGLRGVQNMAIALGIHGNPAYGHTVWADLSITQNQATRDGLAVALAS
ncbi:ATP-binding protein [Actinomadura barringtoniae]|uniref:ATP-binding protein n=1 Tax=Actinomadura barringtoniae TaxID=1427535 RepID=A0A939PSW7_9ACTN|nr:ATP-binding protein [Actinomadura barringtoniae]MBO2454186.1 ATP-binding protein [Actinomadura barringtoniae]